MEKITKINLDMYKVPRIYLQLAHTQLEYQILVIFHCQMKLLIPSGLIPSPRDELTR